MDADAERVQESSRPLVGPCRTLPTFLSVGTSFLREKLESRMGNGDAGSV